MARSKQPQAVKLNVLPKLAKRYDTLKSNSDDARSDMGNFFQEAENDHQINRAAFKHALKIRGMEAEKRTVYLADLNAYCDVLGVFSSPGLFEDPQRIGAAGPDTPSGEPGEGTDGGEDTDDETGDDAGKGDPVSTEEQQVAQTPQEIEAYNLGESEGRAGNRIDANPYTDENLRKFYVYGWGNGQADKVQGQMGNGTRSRRRSTAALETAEPAGVA